MISKRSLLKRFVLFFAASLAAAGACVPIFPVARTPGYWPSAVVLATSLASIATLFTRNQAWTVQEQQLLLPQNDLVEP
jgi:hypothetical protein